MRCGLCSPQVAVVFKFEQLEWNDVFWYQGHKVAGLEDSCRQGEGSVDSVHPAGLLSVSEPICCP